MVIAICVQAVVAAKWLDIQLGCWTFMVQSFARFGSGGGRTGFADVQDRPISQYFSLISVKEMFAPEEP
jgi:hypothetical protein